MRKLFLLLSFCTLMFADSFFTLENTNNLKLYFDNGTDFLTQEQALSIRENTQEKLQDAGIEMDKTDASTFMIKIEAMEIDESLAVLVHIGVGEEVITKRKGNVGTFAWTYYKTDLIDTNEPYEDTLESINYLVNEYVEAYLEDME